jgi:hypothetical protein
MPASLVASENESAFIRKNDRFRIMILYRHLNPELMILESLLWREIRLNHQRSKLESEVHLSVANGRRPALDVRPLLLNLGLDLYIRRERIHQEQGLNLPRDFGSRDLPSASLGGRRWCDI